MQGFPLYLTTGEVLYNKDDVERFVGVTFQVMVELYGPDIESWPSSVFDNPAAVARRRKDV